MLVFIFGSLSGSHDKHTCLFQHFNCHTFCLWPGESVRIQHDSIFMHAAVVVKLEPSWFRPVPFQTVMVVCAHGFEAARPSDLGTSLDSQGSRLLKPSHLPKIPGGESASCCLPRFSSLFFFLLVQILPLHLECGLVSHAFVAPDCLRCRRRVNCD